MAKDMVQMMDQLGYKKFFIAGHDRGGRVAHRLARDFRKKYPEILFRRIFDYGYGSKAFIAYKIK